MKIQFGNRIGRHDSTTRQPGRFVHTLVHGYLSLNIHRRFAYLLAVLKPPPTGLQSTGGLFAQNTELIEVAESTSLVLFTTAPALLRRLNCYAWNLIFLKNVFLVCSLRLWIFLLNW